MTKRLTSWKEWRVELGLTIAAAIGVLSFAQQMLFVADPSWKKLIVSGAASTGLLPAVIRYFLRSGGEQ